MKFQPMLKRLRVWDERYKHWIVPFGWYTTSEPYEFSMYELICRLKHIALALEDKSLIVSQGTGLKDKNGDEIFEGDIISARGETYQVYWDEEVATWRALGDDWDDLYCIAREAEIIGNIFANPELLEKV